MCGRVVTASSPGELSEYMGVDEIVAVLDAPDHNVAPTGQLPIVWTVENLSTSDRAESGSAATRKMGTARWGLVPAWEQDPAVGARRFNARAESVAEKPSFRAALRRRRCLVPVDGFFEWGPPLNTFAGANRKQPWYVKRADGRPMALAGLWERWGVDSDDDSRALDTCTVITTIANLDIEPVHHRMPVLLEEQDWEQWLNPGMEDPAQVTHLLGPAAVGVVTLHPVDRRVGSTKNKGPGLLEAVAPAERSDDGATSQGELW